MSAAETFVAIIEQKTTGAIVVKNPFGNTHEKKCEAASFFFYF